MTKQIISIAVAALVAGLMMFGTVSGQEGTKVESYTADWSVIGGTASGTIVPIDIHVGRFNTDEDIQKFVSLLKKEGADALQAALENEDVGYLATPKHMRVPIAIARKITQGKTTFLRILVPRNLWFIEFQLSGQSEKYPFAILQLDLDANGKGTGTITAGARIRFNKKAKTYEISTFEEKGVENRLLNVCLVK